MTTSSDNPSAVAHPEKQILMAIKEEKDEDNITKLWEKVGWYYESNKNLTTPKSNERFWEMVDTIQETDGLLLSLLDQFGTTNQDVVCLLGSMFKHVAIENATKVLHQVAAAPDSKFLDDFLTKVIIRTNSATIDGVMISIRILYYLSRDQCKLCDQCHVLPILSEFFCSYVADESGNKFAVEGFCILVATIMRRHSKKARLFIVNSGIFIGVTHVLKSRFETNNSLLDLDNYVQAGYFTPDLNETCILNIWIRSFQSIAKELDFCNRDMVKDALGMFIPLVSHYIKQLLKAGTLPSDSFANILGILRTVKHLEADGLECILINAPSILFEDFEKLIILQEKKDELISNFFSPACFENMVDSIKSVDAISLLIEIILCSSCSLPSVSQAMLCIMSLVEHNYEPFVLLNRDLVTVVSTTLARLGGSDDCGSLGNWPPKTGYEGNNAIEISLEMILILIKREPQTVIKILLNDRGIKTASLIDLIKRLKDHSGYNEIILRNKISHIIKKMVKGFSVADHEMTVHLVPFLKESLHKIILIKNFDSLLAQENGSHTYLCNVLQTVKNITMSHDPQLIEAVIKEGNLLSSIISILNLSKNEKVLVNVLQILYILTSKDLFCMALLRTKISALWRKRRISSKSDILIAKLLTSYFLKMSVSYTNTKFAEYYLEQFLKLDSFKFAIDMPGALWLYWTICRSKRNCDVLMILERRSEDTSIDIEFGDIKAAKVYKYLCDIIIEIMDRDPPCDSSHLMDLTKCMIKIAESTPSREELFVLEDLVPASIELSGRIEDKIVIESIEKFISILN